MAMADDGDILDRGAIVGLLYEYKTLTNAINDTRKRQQALRGRIVQFMELEGERSLHDGEHDITVRLQQRAGTPEYDVASLAAREPQVVGRLALIPGFMRVKHSLIKALGDSSMDLAELRKVEVPGQGSTSLIIEDEK